MQVRVDESDPGEDAPMAASPVQTQVSRLQRAFSGRARLRAVPAGS
jgi:hypothetical protein